MRLHPNVVPLVGAAQLAARGAHPILEAPDDHTLVQYAGLKGIPGSGPGVSGYAEEDVLALLANCVRPGDGAVDAAGDQPGVFTHSLDADFLETLWRRLCNKTTTENKGARRLVLGSRTSSSGLDGPG